MELSARMDSTHNVLSTMGGLLVNARVWCDLDTIPSTDFQASLESLQKYLLQAARSDHINGITFPCVQESFIGQKILVNR